MATFNDDNAVTLYYNNSAKLATTSAGVTVTGGVTASSTSTFLGNGAAAIKFGNTSTLVTMSYSGTTGIIRGESGSALEFHTNGVNTALTLDTSQNATFAGDITLSASSSIVLDDTPTASTASGSGTIVNWSVSESVTAGTLYAVKTNGGWTTADADSEAKSTYMLAIALGSNANQGMLLQGFFYKSSHGFTIGAPLYVSTTAGTFSNSRPTASNDYVRIIGYATSTNYIYFDPDKTWVKID